MFKRMSAARILGALVVLLAAVLVSTAPSPPRSFSSMSRHRHVPAIIRERHGKDATSTNWSGYTVTGADGSVTDVKGSWIVPTLTCGATAGYSSFWVGIDGYASNTVEQIGIDADCVNGMPEYSAWVEFYPHWPSTINTVPVRAGDTIFAEVSYGAKGQFTTTLQNVTFGGQPFSLSSKMPQARLSSAEWIVEAPWSGGVLPLADFTVALFGQKYTPQSGTCYATVGGKPGAIGSFNPANVIRIDMVTSSGALKAHTDSLSKDGSSFTDSFISSGP